MGSSTKKHKSEKKKKRSRSPERTKDKHRHHKRHHRDRKRKVEVTETEDLVSSSSNSDVEEIHAPPPPKISRYGASSPRHKNSGDVPPPPPVISDSSSVTEGKSQESLSIEETNKLRAKLGLKPLQIDTVKEVCDNDGKRDKELFGGKDMGEFVHKPPENISDKIWSEKIKDRLAERREKREIEKKLKATKTLGEDSDSEDDDARAWVKKSRQKELERKQAESRAKLLEELDQEFGVGDLVEEEIREDRRTAYTTKDLKGLRVEHALSGFNEGSSIVLTLKDRAVLDEDADVLVNVNMVDDERYKKNIERKKQKPPGSMLEDAADNSVLASKSVLSKYDEEINGETVESFMIGNESSLLEKMKHKLSVKNKLLAKKEIVSLNTSTLKLASDYYSEEELRSKFKKPSKKIKKIRKKPKMLKAEDLISQDQYLSSGAAGSKNQVGGNVGDTKIKQEPISDFMDVDDLAPPVEDLSDIKMESEECEIELQLALSKARKVKLKTAKENNSVEEIAKEILNDSERHGTEGPAGSIVLNSTAEFCRTLGDIPTYGLSGNREEDEHEILDFERDIKEKKKNEEEKRNLGAWNQVPIDEKSADILPNEVPILDAEPDVGAGVAGALRLALSKGYLEKETDNRPSASRFAHLQAQNYSIEDKTHGDEEKFGRRERYVGPTTEFKEKDNYKPNVKLDYIDDEGRILNAKEAFRYLSHKFHGKGPGKNKVEKRMKKNEQEGLMKQMSSTDTPLGTLTMLQQKQRETQSPYVVLSGNKQMQSTTIISKSKH